VEIFNGSTIEREQFTRRRMVVKIGTSTLCEDSGIVRADFVANISEQVLALRDMGVETLLVSSGAVAMGKLRRPDVEDTRLAAALGQPLLMQVWNKAFYPTPALQFLFSEEDFKEEIEIKQLLTSSFSYGIPIINGQSSENNDSIAAKVARMIDADALILLTNKHGVLDKQGKTVPLINRVEEVVPLIRNGYSQGGSYGMGPKVTEALSFVQNTGKQAFIAHGHQPEVLHHVHTGRHQGITRFA